MTCLGWRYALNSGLSALKHTLYHHCRRTAVSHSILSDWGLFLLQNHYHHYRHCHHHHCHHHHHPHASKANLHALCFDLNHISHLFPRSLLGYHLKHFSLFWDPIISTTQFWLHDVLPPIVQYAFVSLSFLSMRMTSPGGPCLNPAAMCPPPSWHNGHLLREWLIC